MIEQTVILTATCGLGVYIQGFQIVWVVVPSAIAKRGFIEDDYAPSFESLNPRRGSDEG